MVRVGVSVAAVTGLVLLPVYFLCHPKSPERRPTPKMHSAPEGLQIIPLEDGWSSMGIAINDNGDVIGNAFDKQGHVRAFIKRDTKKELLPIPKGASMSTATGINDSGAVVGVVGSDEKARGVLWQGDQPGMLTSGKWDTVAIAVSEDNTVAGIAVKHSRSERTGSAWIVREKVRQNSYKLGIDAVFYTNSPFDFGVWNQASAKDFSGMLWKSLGEGKSIGEFAPQASSAEGTLTGVTIQKDKLVPALFKAGKVAPLAELEGFLGIPMAINSEESVVGGAMGEGGKVQPLGWADGHIGFLPVPGDRQGIALGISNQNTIVGVIEAEDGMAHAAIWKDNKVTDLNDLIDKGSGWTLIQAHGINNNEQIVGTALNGERIATFVFGCRKREP
ncbi:MAG: hypothetical protein QM758_22870 [Armatimonas sp.]